MAQPFTPFGHQSNSSGNYPGQSAVPMGSAGVQPFANVGTFLSSGTAVPIRIFSSQSAEQPKTKPITGTPITGLTRLNTSTTGLSTIVPITPNRTQGTPINLPGLKPIGSNSVVPFQPISSTQSIQLDSVSPARWGNAPAFPTPPSSVPPVSDRTSPVPNPSIPVMPSDPTLVTLPLNHYPANTPPMESPNPPQSVNPGTMVPYTTPSSPTSTPTPSSKVVPTTPNPNGTVELSGRIVKVESFKNNHTLVVHAPNRNLYLTVKYNGFMMPREGDNIAASVKMIKDLTSSMGFYLEIVGRPFVQVPSDKESLLVYFIKVLSRYRVTVQKAGFVYDRIREQVDSDTQVENYISIAAANYLTSSNANWINFLINDKLLSYEAAATLMINWHRDRSLRRLYCLGLNKMEIRNSKLSLDVIYDLLLDNPFRVLSLSIEKALQVFETLKKAPTQSQVRCASVARNMVKQNGEGYTGIPRGKMLRFFPDIDTILPELEKDYGVIYDLDLYYLARPHLVETTVCQMLAKIMNRDPPRQYHAVFKEHNDKGEIRVVTEEQKVAVEGALNNNFAIITGKAGTGKTTSIIDLINNLDTFELNYVLTSFTGMAVQRIREVTGKLEANNICTIHQLMNRAKDFQNVDVVVIDEGSMVCGELLYMLGEALGWRFRLIMIGDKNQLRPIDYGTPFEEICRLAMVRPDLNIPVYTLSKIHRTKTPDGFTDGITFNGSQIVDYMDARIINDMNEEDDRVPIECPSIAAFQNFWPVNNPNPAQIYNIINNSLQSGASIDQMVVICPFKAPGEIINRNLQQIVNGTKISVQDKWQCLWHLDDRVVMTINQNDIGIMNGHQGKVIKVVSHEEAKGIIKGEHEDRKKETDKIHLQPLPPVNDPHSGFIEVKFVGGAVHRFYTWVDDKEQAEDDDNTVEGDSDVVGTKQMEVLKEQLEDGQRSFEFGSVHARDGGQIQFKYGNNNGQSVPKRLSTKLLILAFCLTVHKMQGGEKPIVISYLPANDNGRGDTSFLDANLIYTMITRAKQLVYLLGNTAQYNSAIIRPPKLRCERTQVRLARFMHDLPSKCNVIRVRGEVTEFDIVVDQRMLDLASQINMESFGFTIGQEEGEDGEDFYDDDE